MHNKDKYINNVISRFSGNAKDILLKQIDLFYAVDNQITKNRYNIGDDVKLKKGTFIHGIFGELENFDFTIENGFISTDFTSEARPNKICNSVGMWNIQNNMLLKEYINQYSGFTLSYLMGRGPSSKTISKLIPYHKFDEITEDINNNDEIWSYWGPFLDYRYVDEFINNDRLNRNASTTDRESAIMFGLPINLIEGVFVGRKIEKDNNALYYIKSKLPDCYVCNLDGKVIVSNK